METDEEPGSEEIEEDITPQQAHTSTNSYQPYKFQTILNQETTCSAFEDERLSTKTTSGPFPPVIYLNVGGHKFATRLSTLRKDPDSMLATMFSGRHQIDMDSSGYYFIDSNGIYFAHILEFLRHTITPPNEVAIGVYREACYFNINSLTLALETTAPVAKLIIKQSLRESFPNYEEFKSKVIRVAIKKASHGKNPEVIVYAFCHDFVPKYDTFRVAHQCLVDDADTRIGPWDTGTTERHLMCCLEKDLRQDGFSIHPIDKRRRCSYYQGQNCQRYTFKVVFNFDD